LQGVKLQGVKLQGVNVYDGCGHILPSTGLRLYKPCTSTLRF